jgi:hypothetical protein
MDFVNVLVDSCLCGFGFSFASRFANSMYNKLSNAFSRRNRNKNRNQNQQNVQQQQFEQDGINNTRNYGATTPMYPMYSYPTKPS